jgi:hypothetical protein
MSAAPALHSLLRAMRDTWTGRLAFLAVWVPISFALFVATGDSYTLAAVECTQVVAIYFVVLWFTTWRQARRRNAR